MRISFLLLLGLPSTICWAARHPDPVPGIDWDSFGFGLNGVQTDAMWLDRVDAVSGEYSTDAKRCLQTDQSITLSPAATVFNYGQVLFEGLKAIRWPDGSIVVFRPTDNARRMQAGAERFCLPPVPEATFCQAVEAVVRANARWVPPCGKGALYLRPLLMGTGAALGVKPSSESTFCIYCSPVGNYFKGELKPIRLQAVKGYSRAAPGGAGAVKASGNYAPAFGVQRLVRARGFDEILCLDAKTSSALEEAGASNLFVVFRNGTLATPTLSTATILPGVTRQSIIDLARDELGLEVIEGRITLDDMKESVVEAFCYGTGACITPVGEVSIDHNDEGMEDESIVFGEEPGPLTKQLYRMLTDLQTGTDADLCAKYRHWIHQIDP